MKNILTNLLAIVVLAIVASCSGPKEGQSETSEPVMEEAEAAQAEEQTAVCVWDQVSVRETPGAKTKYLTALSIGESLTYLGIDSVVEDKTYSKVRLNDGEEGWSRKDFLVPDAKSAVIVNDINLYSRPDLLTKTDKLFSSMDIVASIETQDDWMSIRGKRSDGKWLDEGWVKGENVSFAAEDIAVAKFAKKALAKESTEDQIAALKEIVDNGDLSNSKFIAQLVVKLTELSEMPEEATSADSIQ